MSKLVLNNKSVVELRMEAWLYDIDVFVSCVYMFWWAACLCLSWFEILMQSCLQSLDWTQTHKQKAIGGWCKKDVIAR